MQFIYKYKRIVLIIKLIVMWIVYKLQHIDYQLFPPVCRIAIYILDTQ